MRAFSGIFVATTLGFAGAAHAQEGLSTKPDYDLIYSSDRVEEFAEKDIGQRYRDGIAALQAKDYAAAEAAFTGIVKRKGAPANTNFLMGLSKIGLEKWSEAQPFLEAAVLDEPKRPEPKTRLGLTYIKLENADAAKLQRDALAGLAADCKTTCADATWISDGIVLLDQALKPGAAAKVSAASLAAVAPASSGEADTGFDPAKYNLVPFDNKEDLYGLLTQEGRCPAKTTAAPRQPCALILYQPMDGSTGALSANFKPVFKIVNNSTIWAIHDKKLQKIKIEDLYYDNVDVIGGTKTAYISVAVIGNTENQANCDAGKQCLNNLVSQDMFRMYGNMPDSVVKVIWGAGMEDPGTIRVR